MHVRGTAHKGRYTCHEDNMYEKWLSHGLWGYDSILQDVMISPLRSRKLQNKAKDIKNLSISTYVKIMATEINKIMNTKNFKLKLGQSSRGLPPSIFCPYPLH